LLIFDLKDVVLKVDSDGVYLRVINKIGVFIKDSDLFPADLELTSEKKQIC